MDNNKRVLLAIALCLGVLIAWQYFFPQNSLIQKAPDQQAQQQGQKAESKPAAKPDPSMAQAEPLPGSPIVVSTPLYKATLLTSGGVLQHFTLSKYKLSLDQNSPNMDLVSAQAASKAPMGLIVDGKASWRDAAWTTDAKDTTLAPGSTATLTFTGAVGGITIKRELTFHADKYEIDEAVTLVSQAPQVSKLAFTLAAGSLTGGEANYNPTRAAFYTKSLEEITGLDGLKEGKIVDSGQWAAVESNYFISALIPASPALLKLQHVDGVTRLAAERDNISLAAGTPVKVQNSYYLGPKERSTLAQAPGNLKAALDYGWFHILAEGCLWLLHFLYGYVHNYGLAIIILTVLIKAAFWPLSQKSYKSMEKMRQIQPLMAAIREKHGEDRTKMNEELMQLYKTYKVNPAGGCLPIMVQIPVFFGLYQALLNSIELRHAAFIAKLPFTDLPWLADLSAKDPYYITPLIMGATMFIQQRMSPPVGDPTQAKIMLFMPVVFTFMFLNFPSGLVIYWLVNNVLSIAQQGMLMKGSAPAQAKKA
ncbi:Membrane protein insertase YidC [Fundidesulfovibrio magnetotacticus]|uniref:Membrane protein insertase YidC n=1 Tax=Fundidesulfovibrio magnetotacticus TaxID=2730080 RepID=A0A6V8LVZ6_9BACT|nr:membrane protein insertase YidC [Fundidesulfovibrio magnetotacticus]GFK92435.1 Membrane protein insertase YidC [Fundidesulfovibrio magnetotacticus]